MRGFPRNSVKITTELRENTDWIPWNMELSLSAKPDFRRNYTEFRDEFRRNPRDNSDGIPLDTLLLTRRTNLLKYLFSFIIFFKSYYTYSHYPLNSLTLIQSNLYEWRHNISVLFLHDKNRQYSKMKLEYGKNIFACENCIKNVTESFQFYDLFCYIFIDRFCVTLIFPEALHLESEPVVLKQSSALNSTACNMHISTI